MQRRFWVRTVAAVMAVWLAAVVAEPAFLHSCPAHGSSHGLPDAAPSAAGHEHHAVEAAPSEPTAPAEAPAGHYCTCLGDCGLTTTAAVPASMVTRVALVTTIAYQLALPASSHTPPSAATLLPFANGPPVSV
jgi:hypothetical protein